MAIQVQINFISLLGWTCESYVAVGTTLRYHSLCKHKFKHSINLKLIQLPYHRHGAETIRSCLCNGSWTLCNNNATVFVCFGQRRRYIFCNWTNQSIARNFKWSTKQRMFVSYQTMKPKLFSLSNLSSLEKKPIRIKKSNRRV